MHFPNHFIKTVLRLMTAGLNNVAFPPCALYASVNCLLEQRRLYSKTQHCQNCSAHSCKEKNKERLSVAAAEMNPATAGIAQLCPLMSTKVSTMEDSVYTAVVYCTRLGPHKSKVVWAGCLGGGEEPPRCKKFHKRLCVAQLKLCVVENLQTRRCAACSR